jgi:DNA polymerase-3 subunit gamma/tau
MQNENEHEQLFRKYRPNTFKQVVGQKDAVKTLKGSLKNGRILRAILIEGPYGVGKTTIGRLYIKHVCCLNYDSEKQRPCGKCESCLSFEKTGTNISVTESNIGTDTGVDNIRSLISNAYQSPIGSRYRAFLLDEVQMLSKAAQNALLKTLEEPPKRTIFLLCTTDKQSLLNTLLSRLTKISLTELSEDDIAEHLSYICEKEKVDISEKIIHKISKSVDGHARDAVQILESVLSAKENGEEIDIKSINNIIEKSGIDNPFKVSSYFLKSLFSGKFSSIQYLQNLNDQGLFVLFTNIIPQQITECLYSAISYEKLANKTKDSWKFKEINQYINDMVKGLDASKRSKFVSSLSLMSDDLILLVERLKNYGMYNTRFICNSFSVAQAKRFKVIND